MISVVYSTRKDKPEFKEHIEKTCGLRDIEIIQIENDRVMSLTEAYNKGLQESKNNIIVFCHDDIIFETNNWGNELQKLFNRNPEYGILGIAGTTDLIDGRWWTIKESMNGVVSHQHEGKKWTNYYSKDQGNKVTEMVVLDGLFFAVDKTKIKHYFDEDFHGFHFYDISFCFPNYLDGVKIGLTTQIRVTHLSIGQTNQQWEGHKIRFEEKYKDKLPVRLTNNKTFEEKLDFDSDSIGFGMVTYNAEHRIRQSAFTVPEWIKNFVIVNDGTPYPEDAYPKQAHIIQHETNKSVGAAKTTAINYLMEQGCQHIFIMEDDILIKDENVFKEYIRHSLISGIKHLNFALHGPANKKGSQGFKTLEGRKDLDGEPNPRMIIPYGNGDESNDKVSIALYPNCVGAFSYYYRPVLEDIGGFDPAFKNAWEHVEHTYQAIKKGYHPAFWYFADINESWKYLTDIPNSIAESTIARTPTWNDNFRKGTMWYKKKHGVTPTETPLVPPEMVQQQLQSIYQNRG
jgi:glycosyltransferase involved in cell wall biosynthesis